MQQHEGALAAYVDSVRHQPGTLAVVLVGSVAQRRERADSDVDVYLVVDDEHFAEASAVDRFAWVERRGVDYPGSYIDIKLASPAYLAAAADHGDDPTRASFMGARVAFVRDEFVVGLEGFLFGITHVSDEVWAERLRSHVAQARLYGGYFLPQAIERDDSFLRQHAGLHLALAAARAALAAGRILLPGPKYVSRLIRTADTPDGFVDAWERVVRDPDIEGGRVLVGILDGWVGGGVDADQALSIFIRDNELAWLRGSIPAEFW